MLVAATLGVLAATPAFALAASNWQVAFAGTGNDPTLSDSFGFMGSCGFGGGVDAGNVGSCDISQHIHGAGGIGFTCAEHLDLTAWDRSVSTIPPTAGFHTFHITGSSTVQPSTLTQACMSVFPCNVFASPPCSAAGFTEVDMQLPAAAGRYNFGGLGATVGEFHVTVTSLS